MKRVIPVLFCIPTALAWVVLLYAQIAPVTGPDETISQENESIAMIGVTLVGLSLLACAASCAMLFVRPGAREWQLAAIFTGAPLLLAVLLVLLLQASHS